YKSGDRVKLKSLTDGIDGLIELVKDFHAAFRYQWFKENKPQGFEIQDARLGGLIMRLSTCKKRLSDYLDGSIDVIEELEEEILPQLDGKTLRSYSWSSIISENRI
ncbi:MAG: beta-N-acetylhexosaminidase, partial [Clostridia bacterium]|nr:beta-N-acetylhexosaminidase [Clostridia bacterium]